MRSKAHFWLDGECQPNCRQSLKPPVVEGICHMHVFGPGSVKIYIFKRKRWFRKTLQKKCHKFQVPYEIFQIESLPTKTQGFFSHPSFVWGIRGFMKPPFAQCVFCLFWHRKTNCLPPGSLTVRPWKITKTQKERIFFQPPFLRGELLNLGGVPFSSGFRMYILATKGRYVRSDGSPSPRWNWSSQRRDPWRIWG